jgi:monoterpene epsilon-lactone hydrolase
MASWQAHVMVLLLKATVKRKLRRAPDPRAARVALQAGAADTVGSDSVGGVPGEWLGPPDAPRTLLYLHGGGYFACSSRTHRPLTQVLARAGLRLFAADYRLAPEHPYPAALDDAVAAYRGLLDAGAEGVVVAGDSAGGGLALALMLRLRELGVPLPGRAALFSPWTDLAATGESIRLNTRRDAMFAGEGIASGADAYVGGADRRDPLISPLYGDLAGLPPLLIHVGADELLRDDSTRLAERARAAGVAVDLKVWPVVPHVWQIMAKFIPEGRQSLDAAARFLLAG